MSSMAAHKGETTSHKCLMMSLSLFARSGCAFCRQVVTKSEGKSTPEPENEKKKSLSSCSWKHICFYKGLALRLNSRCLQSRYLQHTRCEKNKCQREGTQPLLPWVSGRPQEWWGGHLARGQAPSMLLAGMQAQGFQVLVFKRGQKFKNLLESPYFKVLVVN